VMDGLSLGYQCCGFCGMKSYLREQINTTSC
jgi:hypothetical protein